MPLLSIFLVTVSAFFHAGWNLICKKDNHGAAYILAGNTLGALFFLPMVLLFPSVIADFSPQVWALLIVSGFFLALYMFGLAIAYCSSDMSVVYPTVRSLPVLLVTLILMLWRHEPFSAFYFAGSGLVISGLFIVHPRNPKTNGVFPGKLFTASVGYALLSALGATFYALADEKAINILAGLESFSIVSTPMIYMILHGGCASLWLSLFVWIKKSERKNVRTIIRKNRKTALVMGIGMYAGYGLVLIAMVFAANVGYVIAFRQMSIPMGILLSGIILKEKITAMRLAGSLVILAGLIMVGIG